MVAHLRTDLAHINPGLHETLSGHSSKETLLPEGQEAKIADKDREVALEEPEIRGEGDDVVGLEAGDVCEFMLGHLPDFDCVGWIGDEVDDAGEHASGEDLVEDGGFLSNLRDGFFGVTLMVLVHYE